MFTKNTLALHLKGKCLPCPPEDQNYFCCTATVELRVKDSVEMPDLWPTCSFLCSTSSPEQAERRFPCIYRRKKISSPHSWNIWPCPESSVKKDLSDVLEMEESLSFTPAAYACGRTDMNSSLHSVLGIPLCWPVISHLDKTSGSSPTSSSWCTLQKDCAMAAGDVDKNRASTKSHYTPANTMWSLQITLAN